LTIYKMEILMVEILTDVFHIPGVTANPYLVDDGGALTLIDAGLRRSDRKILRFITARGYQPSNLQQILITHADMDHVGGLAGLKKRTPARVFASEIEAKAIARGEMSRPLKLTGLLKWLYRLAAPFVGYKAVEVDEILEPGRVLPILDGLEVIPSPGHTPGHVSFYSRSKGILFAGDSLRSVDGDIQVSKGVNTWDESIAVQSAQAQAKLNPRVVCVGHGPVVKDVATTFLS
jgi:glyoxylase-like metal-dependent hydrolase (beta-lactamase superfamily II)